MNKLLVCLLPALVLLATATGAARADQFSDIQNSPNTYWVPPSAPAYATAPGYYGPYYGPPPPYYYAPPPPPVPHFFFGIHIR